MTLIETTLAEIMPQDSEYRRQARRRLNRLVMPRWALGRLMDLAIDLAGITRSLRPPVKRRAVAVFAADHGISESGVSQYPKEVTCSMVQVFVGGKAGINAVARAAQADVIVVDVGVAGDLSSLAREEKIVSKPVAAGTRNMLHGAAMSRAQAVQCIEAGIEVAHDLNPAPDLLAAGEMGIGNTTAASAVLAAFSGRPAAMVTGRGSGIDGDRHAHKINMIERALQVNQPDPNDALDVLSKVGGFEIGAIAGFVLGAAALKKPIVLDGFPATAGALVAHALEPLSAQYMIAGHRSVECGHRLMHTRLKKRPLLDLRLRLGEGTGAALAMPLIEASARLLSDVATFEEVGIGDSGG
ncbi:MAG: nicotinate-nucleotide--dimethylbenzimidazole phosphoribosyltransferase [Candidatus Abyssobacteria bacterium SURF_5]|uniref:Nicotinate-nucleotide--dimethylbenzimidazole phosphoribosyltransferase n=1 Tax=Abyssobacteria bacterium (strain SURF_5) TaxID=2093360 RepID=A0A3A4NKY9_ABYX5|nr:MAG: nicotinate-nucleotide--dimethylbenzimidazole phosphoribosyltransferase [Candidatus Abyssubacteria bacterium SURF_5]